MHVCGLSQTLPSQQGSPSFPQYAHMPSTQATESPNPEPTAGLADPSAREALPIETGEFEAHTGHPCEAAATLPTGVATALTSALDALQRPGTERPLAVDLVQAALVDTLQVDDVRLAHGAARLVLEPAIGADACTASPRLLQAAAHFLPLEQHVSGGALARVADADVTIEPAASFTGRSAALALAALAIAAEAPAQAGTAIRDVVLQVGVLVDLAVTVVVHEVAVGVVARAGVAAVRRYARVAARITASR